MTLFEQKLCPVLMSVERSLMLLETSQNGYCIQHIQVIQAPCIDQTSWAFIFVWFQTVSRLFSVLPYIDVCVGLSISTTMS
jgi:hypothetical protein